ncbi:MAG: sigma-70 family RNA polymerase sigma factor [Proteobacteria bacterium]|nr:sigma-70 family RNA polymerase sigma factor [Pseudomonadota bacterium]
MDWKERTLSHWDRINALAVRRFGRGSFAEEAALAVIEGLEADNWQRVRTFSGQASFPSFIMAISARIFEDFARKRYGRVRPPLWVRTFGGIWQKLFQALCLERLPVNDAVEVVHQQQVTVEATVIETAAYELLARIPGCGMAQGMEVAYEEEAALEGDGDRRGPVDTFETREQEELFRAVFQLVLGQEQGVVGEDLLKKYQEVKMSLSPEEKLLLKLCYQDGLGVTEAGEMLGITRFQAHGRMHRLLKRLQAEFRRCGLAEALRPLLSE